MEEEIDWREPSLIRRRPAKANVDMETIDNEHMSNFSECSNSYRHKVYGNNVPYI